MTPCYTSGSSGIHGPGGCQECGNEWAEQVLELITLDVGGVDPPEPTRPHATLSLLPAGAIAERSGP